MIYSVDRLSFSYFGGTAPVLNGVSFTVAEGEILTILGPNGAGKSTLLKCLAGLLPSADGCIELCGRSLARLGEQSRAALVSYVQQVEHCSFPYTVEHLVLMGRTPLLRPFESPGEADHEAAHKAMAALGIESLADKPCTNLSGGEYQQAMIARAVVRQPKVILFDEPTAHLDFSNQLRVLRLIKRLAADGFSIVVTTHNPDHALLLGGSAALIGHDGQLKKGTVDEIVTEGSLRRVYGADLLIRPMPEVERVVCTYPKL